MLKQARNNELQIQHDIEQPVTLNLFQGLYSQMLKQARNNELQIQYDIEHSYSQPNVAGGLFVRS